MRSAVTITYRNPPQTQVHRRLSRLLWMALMLQRGSILTLGAYERRYGLSNRQYRRDLATLHDAGVVYEALNSVGFPKRYAIGAVRMCGFNADAAA